MTSADDAPTTVSVDGNVGALVNLPECNFLGFGFLLHLPWEIWLSAAGTGIDGHLASSGELPMALSLASLAHAALDVLAYWFVAVTYRNRRWFRNPTIDGVAIFIVSSFVLTIIAESIVMGLLSGFEHAASLPTVVQPGLGLPSVLQGLVTPLLLLAIVRRQLFPAGWIA